MIAVPIPVASVDDVDAALAQADAAREGGADLVEFRVDVMIGAAGWSDALARVVGESRLPCIVTARSAAEGGLFGGDDDDLAAMIAGLAGLDAPPRYVDVELAVWERSRAVREAVDTARQQGEDRMRFVFSAHDFAGRPADLTQRVARMAAVEHCDVIKVAWMARSVRDNLEAFDLLRTRAKPMIALCMGEFGGLSRVLAGKFGGWLTFAALDADRASAPGQLSLAEMTGLYRVQSLTRDTVVYGVVGWPVAQSASPAYHNAAFAKTGRDAVYVPLPIPDDYVHVKATIGALLDAPGLMFRGCSVTIPHKENLLRFVAEHGEPIEENAAMIGAANTLIVGSDGALSVANTDAPAAVEAVCAAAEVSASGLAEKKVAILGAGGVARAVAVAFAAVGANIIVFNRDQERARRLVVELSQRGLRGKVVAGKPGRAACECWDVVVNCTPLGMAHGPAPEASPLVALTGDEAAHDVVMSTGTIVFDTVYAPEETPLIRAARERGAVVVTGRAMFDAQARLQQGLWGKGAR